jgi:hypothetical protein
MQLRHSVSVLVFLSLLALARPAAASANLGLGADWVEGGSGEFNLTLGADSFLARNFSIGGRGGVAFFDHAHKVAVPLDLRLKLHVQQIYFEGLVGPWLVFDSGDLFYFHAAFGFGIESRGIAFGLEVGKLSDTTLVGLRLLFRL